MVLLGKDGKEEGICPICQEDFKEAVSTDCGHLFCQVCLAQHLEKAANNGVLCCPVCRKPCSEGVLGTGYICHTHQKRVRCFCEESRLLLCEECKTSPEHKSHRELTIEEAIIYYKGRLTRFIHKIKKLIRRIRETGKVLGDPSREQLQSWVQEEEEEKQQAVQVDSGTHRPEVELENPQQTGSQLDALTQQWPNQTEDIPAEVSITPHEGQLRCLLTDLERMVKELDFHKLKDARDLLDRTISHLEALYPKSEKRINKSLPQPSLTTLGSLPMGQLTSDSPQPPCTPSSNLFSPH